METVATARDSSDSIQSARNNQFDLHLSIWTRRRQVCGYHLSRIWTGNSARALQNNQRATPGYVPKPPDIRLSRIPGVRANTIPSLL